MSMPRFPDSPDFTMEDSIIQIVSSIAMEELALSHILNAEAEKLQYILGILPGSTPSLPPTFDQLLEINDSVKDMLSAVSLNQMYLLGKLSSAMNTYSKINTISTTQPNKNKT
jgi:hypothetical protein